MAVERVGRGNSDSDAESGFSTPTGIGETIGETLLRGVESQDGQFGDRKNPQVVAPREGEASHRVGASMSILDEVLGANEEYAATFGVRLASGLYPMYPQAARRDR